MYCKNCGTQVPDNVSYCPACGGRTGANMAKVKMTKKIYQRWWFWVIIVVAALIVIGSSGGNESDNSTSSAETNSGTHSASTPNNEGSETKSPTVYNIKGFSDIEYASKSPVEFTGAEIYTDSDNDDYFILYYTWKNNTDETTAPYLKIIAKVFQDGKELETCYFNVRDFDTDDETTEARPGISLNLHDLWYITDDAPLEVEIQEFWSDDVIASAIVDPKLLK